LTPVLRQLSRYPRSTTAPVQPRMIGWQFTSNAKPNRCQWATERRCTLRYFFLRRFRRVLDLHIRTIPSNFLSRITGIGPNEKGTATTTYCWGGRRNLTPLRKQPTPHSFGIRRGFLPSLKICVHSIRDFTLREPLLSSKTRQPIPRRGFDLHCFFIFVLFTRSHSCLVIVERVFHESLRTKLCVCAILSAQIRASP
jgi:hypothetical protein